MSLLLGVTMEPLERAYALSFLRMSASFAGSSLLDFLFNQLFD
jgi:hypothetical protein